jgi:molybdopterin biosynthesis enzyme
VRRTENRDELVRARLRVDDGAVVLDPLTGQESHMIVRSAAASALVLVPRGTGSFSEGAQVSYLRI